MNPLMKYLACGTAAALLAACGGGTDEEAQQATSPARLAVRPSAQAATQPSAEALTVARVHQALFGKAPGNPAFVSAMAEASANPGAFAGNLTTRYLALSDAAMAKLVLDNMGFTAYSVSPVAYNEIANLVAQLFAAYGPAARGAIVLNLANILAGLGNDATFGKAAMLFNRKVTANLQYSGSPSNTDAGVVGAGTFFINYDSPRDGGYDGYDTFLEDGRYYGTDIYHDGRQNGQLAAHVFGVLGLSNTVAESELITSADFTDDPEKVGAFIDGVYFGRGFNGAALSVGIRVPGHGYFSSTSGTQITYTRGGLKSLYADPLPMFDVAGDYAGLIRSVGIKRPQTDVQTLTIGDDSTFTTTVNDCTFRGKLVPYGASGVFEAQASTSGANCAFAPSLIGVAVPIAFNNERPKFSIALHSADSTQVATFIVTRK